MLVRGQLRNTTQQAYRNVYFCVELFSAEGELRDTLSEQDLDLFVPPAAAVPFRFVRSIAVPPSTCPKHKVVVRWGVRVLDYPGGT